LAREEPRIDPRSGSPAHHDYLAREARARVEIDRQLVLAGWLVQQADQANVSAGPGVAIREFILEKGHGRVDYPAFSQRATRGVIEASHLTAASACLLVPRDEEGWCGKQ
jgi:type I site-specific restriction endonuclease